MPLDIICLVYPCDIPLQSVRIKLKVLSFTFIPTNGDKGLGGYFVITLAFVLLLLIGAILSTQSSYPIPSTIAVDLCPVAFSETAQRDRERDRAGIFESSRDGIY